MSGYIFQLPTPKQYALMDRRQRAQAVRLFELNNKLYKQQMKVKALALARAVRQENLERRRQEQEELWVQQWEREARQRWEAERSKRGAGQSIGAVRLQQAAAEAASHSRRKAGGTDRPAGSTSRRPDRNRAQPA